MPKPSVCLAFALCQYLELFRGCFKPRQWKYFVTVLSGLVECQERRTLSGLQRTAGNRPSLSSLSRFMGWWSWAADKPATIWQSHFRKEMASLVQEAHTQLKAEQVKQTGRAKKTIVRGYLVLDDSVHHKPKGKKMEGLGKPYSSTEQRVVTGHNLFTGVYLG